MSAFRIALLMSIVFSTTAYAGDSLGRLFLTPDQRRTLDELRGPSAPDPGTDLGTNPLPAGTPANRTVLLNGVVRRSHGSDVVWVNGARAGADNNQHVQLRRGPDQRNRVVLEDARGAMAKLKPGQFWDTATGQVANCFGCGIASGKTPPAADAPATQP
ncbi:MAG: hypothetical protein Q8N51_13175 [Gammaproteobacteria bacterium]|nr:hypothetical protein [Gammaproteobacteria bacterium]